jgi:TolB-like protein
MTLRRMFTALFLACLLFSAPPAEAGETVPGTAGLIVAELGAQLSERFGTPGRPVKGLSVMITTPVNLNNFKQSSALARLMGEELAADMVEAGFVVAESRKGRFLLFKPQGGEFMLTRKTELLSQKTMNSELVLLGTYLATSEHVRFNVRLVSSSNGETLAMAGATMPLTLEAAELLGGGAAEEARRLRPSVRTALPTTPTSIMEKARDEMRGLSSGYVDSDYEHPIYAPGRSALESP